MNDKEIKELIDVMPLKKRVGQLFVLAFPGKDPENFIPLIKDYGIGGVYISQDNAETLDEARSLTKRLEDSSEIPLLNGVDQEGAWGVLLPESTTGPGNLSLGATGNYTLTREMYSVIGDEMSSVGYNTVLGPCADINLKPDNPIIDTRSFGEDPVVVGKHVEAAVKGLRDGGAISTAKHFPGHGDTSQDTHREIPAVNKDLETLEREDLYPFKKAIDAGVDIVMTAHIKYPLIDSNNPATFSEKILKGILRERLGFKGLILSDSMNMGAIRRYYKPEDSSVLAINAGVDLIMLSEEHYDHDDNYLENQIKTIENLISYVENGRISKDLINSILYRVIKFKSDKGLFVRDKKEVNINYSEIEKRAARSAITLLRDNNSLWPVNLENSVFINSTPRDLYKKVMNPRGIGPNQSKPGFDTFKEALIEENLETGFLHYEDIDSLSELDRFKNIFVITEDYPLPGEDFCDARVEGLINSLLERFGKRILIIGLRSPYDILKYKTASFYLTSYSSRNCSAAEAARVILSGDKPEGLNSLKL